MAQNHPNFAPGDNDRVHAAIDNWKRKLLDLTKRNRALNFKVSKVSTVTIVDELAPEVFRHLYLNERPMRFRATDERLNALINVVETQISERRNGKNQD